MATLLAASAVLAESEPLPVSVRPLQEVVIYPPLEAYGTALSVNESRISAEVSARIIDIPARVGQIVPRGATLVALDSKDFELAVQSAEASLEAARARTQLAELQFERAKTLVEKNFMSRETLNQRETELAAQRADAAASEARLAGARRNLEKTRIRAPFKSIIKERAAGVGETAAPGMHLLAILDAERIEVSAQIQPQHVAGLRETQEIIFATSRERFPVVLLRVVPALSARERTQEARFTFRTAPALPGEPGRILWRSARPHVPADLLVRRHGGLGIFVVNDGRARFVALPQAEEGRAAPVAEPLSSLVVVEERHRLNGGEPVNPARTPSPARP